MRRLSLTFVVLLTGCFSAVGEPSDGGVGGGSGGAGGSGGSGAGGGSAGGSNLSCTLDSDCVRGEVCEACGNVKSCVQGCRSDADCGRPMTCQAGVVCLTCPCASAFCALDACVDADRDGFVTGSGTACSGKRGGDCDDANALVNPAATERCGNGRDDDCDGLTDGNDPQCRSCSTGGGCSTAWDCGLGVNFCDKKPGTVPACCTACPQFEGDCVLGTSPQAHGIDPLTGCNETACINSNIGCPENFDPICGMNGQTYGNTCELQRAQVQLLHPGACVRGENLDCGINGPGACGTSGTLYCRDACPTCDAWVMRCTKVGVCVNDLDCPAGAAPPPALCPDGGFPRAACQSHSCQWACQ